MNYSTLTRRALLSRATACGALVVAGAGFIAAPNAVWALEVTVISEHDAASLLQMARDIYPHDQIDDAYYAIAIKGYDSEASKEMVANGIAELDALAVKTGATDYISIPDESTRVEILKSVENGPFFQTIRGGLVTGLYNQKEVWGVFGYEGESFSKGGYINRGFDDISWL